MKAFRIDLVIAICALLVSTLATAATWWQSRVVGQQLSAQVWPYVSLVNTLGPDRIEIAVANDGPGPAIIKTAVLTVDGKPQRTVMAAIRTVAGDLKSKTKSKPGTAHLSTTSLNPGSVLRPLSTRTVVTLVSAAVVPRVLPELRRVKLEVCYCSILDACWIVATSQDFPQEVAHCPDRSRDELQEST
jgi:hypothetical protein